MGDVHPLGNPHYWLDPGNGRRIAQAIAQKLAEIAPTEAAYFQQKYVDFHRRLSEAEKRWDALIAPYKGLKIVTYHGSWSSFAERFGLDVIGYVEPRPGIPPSATHIRNVIEAMRAQNVKLLLVEFLLRPQDAKCHRPGDRRAGTGDPSFRGWRQGSDRLSQVIRLQPEPAHHCDYRYELKPLSADRRTTNHGTGGPAVYCGKSTRETRWEIRYGLAHHSHADRQRSYLAIIGGAQCFIIMP